MAKLYNGTYAAFALLLLAVPLFADAALILRSGEKVTLDNEQVVSGDFYTAGNTVSISGSVEGDLYAAGRSVTVNGDVTEDIVTVGGSVQIHGPVGDGVRALGGEVVIADAIEGDVVVLAGVLNILPTASVAGDVFVLSGTAHINGDVSGTLTGAADSVRINGSVNGDITITTDSLTLGEQAYVGSNLTYSSDADLARAPGSVVVGDIEKTASEGKSFTSPSSVSVIPFLALLFTTLVYLFLFREWMDQLTALFSRSVGMHGVVGISAFAVAPIVIVLLIVTILGSLVGVTLLIGYLLLLAVAWSLSGIFLGSVARRLIHKKTSLNVLWAVLGVVLVQILALIPLAGPVLLFGVVCVIMGSLLSLTYKTLR